MFGRVTDEKGKPRRARLPVVGQAEIVPERRDAARNRARILEAARKLLEERPIQEICMDELARTAGVGKGTLYRRFADRASLCRALLHEESIVLQNRVLAGFDLPNDARWMQRLECFLDALFDFYHDNAALLSEALAFERGPTRFEQPHHTWMRETIALYLGRSIETEEIGALEPTVTAELILAGLDPDLMQWHRSCGLSRDELKEHFRRFWRQGAAR
jgi:AcrR family transcriptional regulator